MVSDQSLKMKLNDIANDLNMTSFIVTVTKGNLPLPIHQRFKNRFKEKKSESGATFFTSIATKQNPRLNYYRGFIFHGSMLE